MIGTIILVTGLIILLLAIVGIITTLAKMTKPSCIEGGVFYYILFVFSRWLLRMGLLISILGAVIYGIQHIK